MAHEIRLTRRIAASPADVYDAWLDPASLKEWMIPRAGTRSEAQIDARVGGQFRIDMIITGQKLPHTGEYLRLERPRLLEFTWISNATLGLRSVVTVELEPAGVGHTELTLRHRLLPTSEAASQHLQGWGEVLRCLSEASLLPAQRAAAH